MRFGVVVFPGTWSDCDFHYVISEVLHQPVEYVWHRDTDLDRLRLPHPPGRLLLRRLSTRGRGGRVARRSSRRCPSFVARGGLVLGSLQRLPDPLRGGAPSGRAHAERVPPVPLPVDPRRASSRRETPVHPRRSGAARSSRCRSRTARASTTPSRDPAPPAPGARPDRLPVRDGGRRESPRAPTRTARSTTSPGSCNEEGTVARADAAPRARGRDRDGQHRRAAASSTRSSAAWSRTEPCSAARARERRGCR